MGHDQPAAGWICVAAARDILVVDDNAEIRETVSVQLTSLGYKVAVAADANAPTGKIKSSGFEAVKSDADAGMVMEVPLMVAVMTRIPSGILSTT